MSIQLGQTLGDFSCITTDSGEFSAAQMQGHYTLIFFYPKASTPGCTQESIDFSENYHQFKALGVEVYGASRDSLKRQEAFKHKNQIPFALISDEQEVLCQACGVIQEKKLYGKTSLGIVRSTFLFDPQGRLVAMWMPVKVKGHAEAVLQKVQELLA